MLTYREKTPKWSDQNNGDLVFKSKGLGRFLPRRRTAYHLFVCTTCRKFSLCLNHLFHIYFLCTLSFTEILKISR